jgi:Crinkler effector protein N-terminal domain
MSTSVLSQDASRRLNCLIENEYIPFIVTVGRDYVVSELKEEIQGKRAMDILKDVGPHTLELWKVSAIDESRCEVTSLTPTIGRH